MYPGISVFRLPDNKIQLSGKCIIDNAKVEIIVPEEHYENYLAGALMQEAFPTLDADQREFLISGIGPGKFDGLFPEEDDSEKQEQDQN